MTDQEINEAVARKLGWTEDKQGLISAWRRPNSNVFDLQTMIPSVIPDYCRDIKAAWEIMEKYDIAIFKTNKGRWCTYTNFGLEEDNQSEWYFSAEEETWIDGGIFIADTAPMAICKAFLKLEK